MRWSGVAMAGLLALAACGADDVVGIHIRLTGTGAGSITTQSLQIPGSPGPAEPGIRSVQWTERVDLFASRGSFEQIADVEIGEITFEQVGSRLVVLIPRGARATWYRALAPATEEERRRAASTFDPTGKAKNVGTVIKFDIEVPGTVVAEGMLPSNVRGVQTTKDKNTVSAMLPLTSLRQEGDPLRWEVTWN